MFRKIQNHYQCHYFMEFIQGPIRDTQQSHLVAGRECFRLFQYMASHCLWCVFCSCLRYFIINYYGCNEPHPLKCSFVHLCVQMKLDIPCCFKYIQSSSITMTITIHAELNLFMFLTVLRINRETLSKHELLLARAQLKHSA